LPHFLEYNTYFFPPNTFWKLIADYIHESSNRLTSQSIALVVKLIFPAFYGIRRFTTAFTEAHHRSLSRARWIQSTLSQTISLRSILILPYNLRLGLPSGLFPSSFPTKILYTLLFYHMRATCPTYFIALDLIILIISDEEHAQIDTWPKRKVKININYILNR
jgi:hypothetical protein